MDNRVSFVSKVYKVRTRTKGDKDYYVYRMNIPKEESDKLQLSNNDYLFVESAMKAKWYHLLKWEEMSRTWNIMPEQLKDEIRHSGVKVPIEQKEPQLIGASPTRYIPPFLGEQKSIDMPYSTGLSNVSQRPWM